MPIDPTKVYGKVNGEGSYVQCFPIGMKSAGSAHDTFTASEAVVNVGSIDLGTLTWTYRTDGTYPRFGAANIQGMKYASSGNFNALCPKYLTYPNYEYDSRYRTTNADKTIAYIYDQGTNYRIAFQDTSYTDSDLNNGHASWLDGVKLNYELATPITYTDLIYSEDGGQTGTPLTEFKYKVDKYSTEELIVPSSQTGAPTSTALNADIDYQYRG